MVVKQYLTTSECRNAAYSGVHPGKAGKALSAKARPAGAGWPLVTGRPGPGSACPPRSPCFSCDVPSGDTSVQQRAFGSLSGKGVEVAIVRGQNLISRFLSHFLYLLSQMPIHPRSVFPENKSPVSWTSDGRCW